MSTYLKNAVTLELDAEARVGCGMCEIVCPHGVFVVEGGKARMVDRDACMECGVCARNCPVAAIAVAAGVGCANRELRIALGGSASCGGDFCCGD